MARQETDYLGEMVRTHPGRTCLFTVGPVLFGLVQLVNGYLNDGSLLFAALFLGVMAAFSAMVTRYHLVTFRIDQFSKNLDVAE